MIYLRYGAIGAFLLGLFWLPIYLFIYGALGAATFGGAILGVLILVQWPLYLLFRRIRESGKTDANEI